MKGLFKLSRTTSSFFCFFFFLFSTIPVVRPQTSSLRRGSFLSVENDKDVIISDDKTFTLGFNNVGRNAYCLSIWFTPGVNSERTVVWTANRDSPVNGRGSKLSMGRNGDLVLTDVDGSSVWATGTTSPGATAELLDAGNLVVKNSTGNILWESFSSPTDTILPSQPLTKGTKLVSAISKGSPGSGYYSLYFDNDNVLRLIYDGPEISSIYWPNPDYTVFQNGRTNYNSSRVAVLDRSGWFNSSDNLNIAAADSTGRILPAVKRRLTMDYDGNLRIYSLNTTTGLWTVTWQAIQQLCTVHGLCGRNGICGYLPELTCSCPPGYVRVDPTDWNKGCKPKFNGTCTNNTNNLDYYKFVELKNTDYYGFDLVTVSTGVSFRTCMEKCLNDCSCVAFGYRDLSGQGDCYPKSTMFNGYTWPDFPGTMHIKLPITLKLNSTGENLSAYGVRCDKANVTTTVKGYGKISGRFKWEYLYGFVVALGGFEMLFVVTGWWYLLRDNACGSMSQSEEEGYRMVRSQFRKFSYGELREATGKFREEIGKGGSGAVYRGVLDDNRVVAVKKLWDVVQGEEEFWAEVSVIGRINHMNLVRLWGFCTDRHHRLLVYEFLPNRSLDKFLFSSTTTTSPLQWNQRFKIAVGTARGLAYLHHECLEWVVHCDVKPQNILLDADFEAKIADFGLAKLSRRDVASGLEFSQMRGTMGYMAPEWVLGLPITAKVDVYSYGVVLLELVTGRSVSDGVTLDGETMELRRFAKMLRDNLGSGEEEWLEQVVDGRLHWNFERRQIMSVIEVAVNCVEEERSRRPTMSSVLQTLLDCE